MTKRELLAVNQDLREALLELRAMVDDALIASEIDPDDEDADAEEDEEEEDEEAKDAEEEEDEDED